jgi:hypothetical protein
MHDHAIAVLDRREASQVSPVIAGGMWLEDEPEDDRRRSLVLQLRLPVSADELAAAPYYGEQLCPADLADDENLWGFAAAAIVQDGMNAIELRADLIARDKARGTLANQGWREHFRRRVAEVTGTVLPGRDADGALPGPPRVRALTGAPV